MSKRAVIALALLLASPAGAIEDMDGSLASLSPDDRAALAKALDISFYDGATARLREVRMAPGRKVCGWANLKALNGAYTGYRLFAADLVDGAANAAKRVAQVGDVDGGLGDYEAICIATKHKQAKAKQ